MANRCFIPLPFIPLPIPVLNDAWSQFQGTALSKKSASLAGPSRSEVPSFVIKRVRIALAVPIFNFNLIKSKAEVPNIASDLTKLKADVPNIAFNLIKLKGKVPIFNFNLTKSEAEVPIFNINLIKSEAEVPILNDHIGRSGPKVLAKGNNCHKTARPSGATALVGRATRHQGCPGGQQSGRLPGVPQSP